eukprot:m.199773 g.199773  ORF g.199773 m.199773 type:complete len:236 (-) comp20824_c0_seq2:188-895(-)
MYTRGREQVRESKLVREERDRFEAELKRIEQMDGEQRAVYFAQQDVENLAFADQRCPRCESAGAFDTADGCCALYCTAANCGAGFCAWCQHDCGKDAHNHVSECPEVPAGVDGTFPRPDQLKAAQHRRKARLVTEYLRQLPSAERRTAVVRACARILHDLGLEDAFAADGGGAPAAAAAAIRARAMFDYQAADPDELTFNEGDVINSVAQIDDAWWKGELRGVVGLFPANFVQLF